jgi:hypothetical protein
VCTFAEFHPCPLLSSIQMADEKADVVSLDAAFADGDEALRKLLHAHGSLRQLWVEGAYSGSVLTDVLIARRVLSLDLQLARESVLPLSSGVSTDSLLVTRLRVFHRKKGDHRLFSSSAVSAGALLALFPALTSLNLSFSGSARLPLRCALRAQSARAPALEELFLRPANLSDGASTQLAAAIRLRLARSLSELYICDWAGTDADGAEVIRSLSECSRLECLYFFRPGGSGTGVLTATEIAKLLVGNTTLTRLTFDCCEEGSKASPLSALVDAVRSNPLSALTDLGASRCLANDTGAVALASLIELPRIHTLFLKLSNAQATVRFATLQRAPACDGALC